jgi:D-alanyl-lipoteichoic acid acyltransferase DltB (MBOAT superfamily)
MIFHSLEYLIFFVAVFALYWCLPRTPQNVLLLGASYLFYGWIHPWFLIPLLLVTAVDYFCAIGIERSPRWRKAIVVVSLVSSLGMLVWFKYAGFFVENVRALLGALGLPTFAGMLEIVLPVGISFYTFQSIGYIVDVYRGHARACRNLLDYALYVCFFPQLVAGPIERASRLIGQIAKPRAFDAERAQGAVVLIAWGVFKKLVVADNAAVTCNKVFALREPDFALLWAGVFAFAVQIFADFSAYTDIARGSARLLGFELMENFRNPYFAHSPAEFWRRWHISLSTWLRDYVYIPLGGSRGGARRTAINLVLTFFISGLWHGAQWNFILWGLYWGMLVVVFRFLDGAKGAPVPRFRALRIAFTFALTCIGWLLFRESDLRFLTKYLTLSPLAVTVDQWQIALYLVLLTLVYSAPIWLHAAWTEWAPSRLQPGERPALRLASRVAGAALLLLGILVMRSTTSSDFIYFQF